MRVRVSQAWKTNGNEYASKIKVGMTGRAVGISWDGRYNLVELDDDPYGDGREVMLTHEEIEVI